MVTNHFMTVYERALAVSFLFLSLLFSSWVCTFGLGMNVLFMDSLLWHPSASRSL